MGTLSLAHVYAFLMSSEGSTEGEAYRLLRCVFENYTLIQVVFFFCCESNNATIKTNFRP